MDEGHRGTPGAVVHEGVDVEGGDTLAGERHEQLVDGQRTGVAGVHGALEVVDEDPRGDRLIRGVLDGEQWSHEPVSSCLVWFILPWHGSVGTLAARGDGRRDRRRRGGRVRVVRWSWSEHGLGSAPGENPPQSLPGRATSSVLGSVRRFGVLSGFVRVSARERRLASWALLPTPSGLSMFPPAPGWGALFALGVPVGASAGE